MNFLPILLIAFLLGGEKLSSLKEFLAHVDFNSFSPILKILGFNQKTIDFLCSENFSSMLNKESDLKNLLPFLLSTFNKQDEQPTTKTESSQAEYSTPDEFISPIKNVAPTDVEETFSSYFS
jgi:hypothetical protein